eukprot:scaffold37648_cov22-Tisochrysis_lutea.AAC.2
MSEPREHVPAHMKIRKLQCLLIENKDVVRQLKEEMRAMVEAMEKEREEEVDVAQHIKVTFSRLLLCHRQQIMEQWRLIV